MSALERGIGLIGGLLGGAGVVLAAAGAHMAPGRSLDQAALVALVHGPAIFAVLAGGRSGVLRPLLALVAAGGFAAGTLLFSGQLALRSLADLSLFRMAAPTGGFILIGAWIVAALAALTSPRAG